jgi:hypothetical protein
MTALQLAVAMGHTEVAAFLSTRGEWIKDTNVSLRYSLNRTIYLIGESCVHEKAQWDTAFAASGCRKEGMLVAGPSKSGKTTMLNRQMGSIYRLLEDGRTLVHEASGPQEVATLVTPTTPRLSSHHCFRCLAANGCGWTTKAREIPAGPRKRYVPTSVWAV